MKPRCLAGPEWSDTTFCKRNSGHRGKHRTAISRWNWFHPYYWLYWRKLGYRRITWEGNRYS